jgi:hypothetical protein
MSEETSSHQMFSITCSISGLINIVFSFNPIGFLWPSGSPFLDVLPTVNGLNVTAPSVASDTVFEIDFVATYNSQSSIQRLPVTVWD